MVSGEPIPDCASEGREEDDDMEDVASDSLDTESDSGDVFLDASEYNTTFEDLDDTEDEGTESCEDNEEEEEDIDDIWERYQNETLPQQGTTKAQALLLLLAYIVAAGLSWTQIEGLLILLNQLLGESVFPQTKCTFRKIWKSKMQGVKLCYFCGVCHRYLSDSVNVCRTALLKCTCPGATEKKVQNIISAGHFFIIFDLRQQLTDLLKRIGDALYRNLKQYTYSPGSYSDLTDGNLYRSIRHKLKMRWSDITVTFNADGAPVFKSSKSSVWPLQFFINELPVQLRWQNVKVAGLWFAKEHPPMHLFLTAFVKEINNIGSVVWSSAGEIIKSSVYVISCCVDTPARAAILNMKRFNSYFGCPWCLERGTPVDRE